MSIFRKIKDAISSDKGKDDSSNKIFNSEKYYTLKRIYNQAKRGQDYDWSPLKFTDSEDYKKLKLLSSEEKIEWVNFLHDLFNHLWEKRKKKQSYTFEWSERAADELIRLFLKQKIDFEFDQLYGYLLFYNRGSDYSIFYPWPTLMVLTQIEKLAKRKGLEKNEQEKVAAIKEWPGVANYESEESRKAKKRIDNILLISNGGDLGAKSYKFSDKDDFGASANSVLDVVHADLQVDFYSLLIKCEKASQSKPSKKFLTDTKKIIDTIGSNKYKELVRKLLECAIDAKNIEITSVFGNYQHTVETFLDKDNSVVLKGLAWTFSHFHDSQSLQTISSLAERSFKKIPDVGASSQALGNACIYTLSNSKGTEGIGYLSRLKLLVPQSNTKKLIQKYIEENAARLGYSSEEIEDMATQDFGLEDGFKSYSFKDYQFQIEIKAIGKIDQKWIKPNGDAQKSVPQFVKDDSKLNAQLKKVKAEVKMINKMLTAVRDRIDRQIILDRKMPFEFFKKHYLNHGLVSFIAKNLIWTIDGNTTFTGVFKDDKFVDVNGKEIEFDAEQSKISLWHPINSDVEFIMNWRNLLMEWSLTQPIKQAFREVYLLTDAEVNTEIYSNRMAAHIIKQHQFNALAKLRGWEYQLLGGFDHGGMGNQAIKQLPEFGLTAEFWIVEMFSDEMTDLGIWTYISTDQVRFSQFSGEPVKLSEVPKIVFSEIMRDVDMFVGVCSVGNDPDWMDTGGGQQFRDYWNSYSFGDLSEIAKTRKSILETILPKLKIKDKCQIDGKFLIVQGKLKTYKIHIGSTNILMEPNDQYLCIVPSSKQKGTKEKVFLPFEGDGGFSILLSKAFLLAEDDKIKDPTILSQIGSN